MASNQIFDQSSSLREFEDIPEIQGSESVIYSQKMFRKVSSKYAESVVDELWDARTKYKNEMAQMGTYHLDEKIRGQLSKQIDRLFDIGDVSEVEIQTDFESFKTLIRTVLNLHPANAPILTLTDTGHFVGTWITGHEKFRLECYQNDKILWYTAAEIEGKIERSSGESFRILSIIKKADVFIAKGWFNPDDED